MKKLIALVLSVIMIISLTALSVSAATADGVIYKWRPEDYHHGWSQSPDHINYSTGGYITLSDTRDKYMRQHQARYVIDDAPISKNIEAKIDLANAEYSGILSVDMIIKQCSSSNYTLDESTREGSGAQLKFFVEYRFKDPENYDEELNPGAWTSMQFERDGWVDFNKLTTYKIPVDGYLDYLEGADDPDLQYSDFEIVAVQVHVMGYCFNAFNGTDPTYPYQAGIRQEIVTFSPAYIDELGCPEQGEDLGECYEFIPDPDDETAPGTFIINGVSCPQGETYDGAERGRYGNQANALYPQMKFGDANGDSSINAKDVLLMRKFVAKQKVDPNLLCADVIVDLTVNAKDVLQLRKFVAKQKVTLGAFTPKSKY